MTKVLAIFSAFRLPPYLADRTFYELLPGIFSFRRLCFPPALAHWPIPSTMPKQWPKWSSIAMFVLLKRKISPPFLFIHLSSSHTPLSAILVSFRAIESLTFYAADEARQRRAFHSLLTVRWFLFHVSQFEKAQLAGNVMGVRWVCVCVCVLERFRFFMRFPCVWWAKAYFLKHYGQLLAERYQSIRRMCIQLKMASANWVNVWYAIFCAPIYTRHILHTENSTNSSSRFFLSVVSSTSRCYSIPFAWSSVHCAILCAPIYAHSFCYTERFK